MNSTTFHGRIERDRFTRHGAAAVGDAFVAAWQLAARAYLGLQAAHTAHAQARAAANETRLARALASRHAASDPGFAADLNHAVMRHEQHAAPAAR